jgi:predicted transcriptional regulator
MPLIFNKERGSIMLSIHLGRFLAFGEVIQQEGSNISSWYLSKKFNMSICMIKKTLHYARSRGLVDYKVVNARKGLYINIRLTPNGKEFLTKVKKVASCF